MRISDTYPPNYRELASVFDFTEQKPVFCWGDTIHNPFERDITPDIEVHEEVHSHQQAGAPEVWYAKYIYDADFRLAQELEAYGAQYAFVQKYIRGALNKWALDKMAQALSSDAYCLGLNEAQAKSKIRNAAKV